MAERCFIDTNVAVYLLSDEPHKASRAEHLMLTRPCISAQVLNEFISICTRKLGFSRAAAHENARALMGNCDVEPITASTVEQAMRLGERYQLSHWDALILASAQLAGCRVLYSEDMQDGMQFDGLSICNPFA
ncbi:MAG: PIN domain-containing protein [Betaproteobacteria bacterium]|nr:PIN domain-containing protein [Betaproteobacteria bacterium]